MGRAASLQRLRRRQRGAEQGFTLVELLIVITVLPLVVGAISMGMIAVFRLQAGLTNRVSDTNGAQVVSSTFVKDVQSAAQVTTQSSSSPQCGTSSSGVSQLLGLQWSGGLTVVSYDSVPIANGTSNSFALVRRYCTLGNITTPSRVSYLAYDLSSTQASPAVACASSCSAASQWVSASEVQAVRLAVTEPASNYSFALEGTPRAWTSSGGGGSGSGGGQPYAPFTLLGTSACPSSSLNIGNGTLSINVGGGSGNGALALDSPCPNSITIANGGSLLASSILTTDASLNSVAPNSNATYPSTEYYNSEFPDPLASLAPPNATGPAVSCSVSSTTYTCPSGNYSTALTFPNGSTINFTGGGTYWFEQGLTIPNNADVTFGSAAYIFDGTTSLQTGSSSGTTITGTNVLFYIASGSANFGNNESLTLTPLAGDHGVTVWDAVNGGTLTISNNATVTSYGGIYIPNGTLVDGNNASVSATFIVAGAAQFANGLTVNITAP